MKIGFAIHECKRRVSPETVQKFHGLPVANVSDVMARIYGAQADLQAMHDGSPMAGPAFTVKTRPGDNLMVHKALELAPGGSVIVVDAGGNKSNAIIGEIMVAYAKLKHLAGIVINGAIRDSAEIRKGNFPVFATGITHRGPYKDGPGEINVPICLGNMVIEPGDLVLGDSDGVLSVPYDAVEKVYEAAMSKQKAEERMLAEIEAGTYEAAWVDEVIMQRLQNYN